MKSAEIGVTPIHNIDRAWHRLQQIECMYIGHFAVGDMNKAWNIAFQVKQCMHLHGSLSGAEMCPREHRQTQVYCC